jgi:hypothetical protein
VEKSAAEKLLELPKFCSAKLTWGEKKNHAGLLIATAALDDETGATIPGLTLQLEIKKAILVERFQFELGLFILVKGVRTRVYQLNVTPLDRKSHNDPVNPIYGPHQHIGSRHAEPVQRLQSGDFAEAFCFFCTKTNITFTGSLNLPS